MLEDMKILKQRQACKTRDILESLSAEDQAILQGFLNDKTIGDKTLSRSLNSAGIVVSAGPLNRHRTGQCYC